MNLCSFTYLPDCSSVACVKCTKCGRTISFSEQPGRVFAMCSVAGGSDDAIEGESPKPINSFGPGAELHVLLSRFGITSSGDCKCNSRAAYMDRMGCDWCEANIDEIVGWLRESAAERGLPFVDIAGRVLVRRAIHKARRKEQARAQEASQAEGGAAAG